MAEEAFDKAQLKSPGVKGAPTFLVRNRLPLKCLNNANAGDWIPASGDISAHKFFPIPAPIKPNAHMLMEYKGLEWIAKLRGLAPAMLFTEPDTEGEQPLCFASRQATSEERSR
jgi:hypothetical protein